MSTDIRDSAGPDWIEPLRAQLTTELASHQARLSELTADTSDATEAHNQEAMATTTRESLDQINAALQRIDEGRYGYCESCADGIPRERLEILPHARYCVPCQQKFS